jgi:hypothetical protein
MKRLGSRAAVFNQQSKINNQQFSLVSDLENPKP